MQSFLYVDFGFLPECFQGWIEQLELTIGSKHRDRFLEMIQRFSLNAHQCVVVAFQRQAFGDVFIDPCTTALATG